MPKIINVLDHPNGIEAGIKYIHSKWGNQNNYAFYQDAIINSSHDSLPQFYVMIENDKIIGCSALITNDFISRHDLYPWVACLFVEKEHRGKKYGNELLEHARAQSKLAGFDKVYLTTDHEYLYERFDWERIEDGIDLFSSEPTRIYRK